jgi:penicillin-binding protein 1A
MAAKNNNRGTTADKDFKYYTRTFEDFSSRDGWYPSVFLFASWGFLNHAFF